MRCGIDGVSLCTENFSTESIIMYFFTLRKKEQEVDNKRFRLNIEYVWVKITMDFKQPFWSA